MEQDGKKTDMLKKSSIELEELRRSRQYGGTTSLQTHYLTYMGVNV